MARIAFVTTSYPSWVGDPSGHFVEDEATTRALRGDTVVVLAPGEHHSRTEGVTVHGLPGASSFGWPGALERVRERPYRAFAAGAFVVAACGRLRALGAFDEIVAHWILPCGFPIACAGTGAIEIVLHGSDVRMFARLPRVLRDAITGHLISREARFRFVSRELRDVFVRASTPRILDSSSIVPCPIGTHGAATRSEARVRFGVGVDERVAVVVGRLVAGKHPLEAIRMALRRDPDRVVVIGDGPMRDDVKKSDPRVVTVGLQSHSDTLAWISAADYLVSASRFEGSPTAIREARALGVPVVTVPCGDIEEWARFDPGIEIVHS